MHEHNQCRRKHQEGTKRRFTDEQKEQAVKMCAEGISLSAAARVVGANVTMVSKLGKKRELATERLTRFAEQAEQAYEAHKGLHKERGDAETSAGDSI